MTDTRKKFRVEKDRYGMGWRVIGGLYSYLFPRWDIAIARAVEWGKAGWASR